jgi:hypothetical protein
MITLVIFARHPADSGGAPLFLSTAATTAIKRRKRKKLIPNHSSSGC